MSAIEFALSWMKKFRKDNKKICIQVLAFVPIWSKEYKEVLCMLLPGAEGEICFEDLVEKRKPPNKSVQIS
jgi:hypothetical protein